ncbi:M16 family metallopeptidase [Chlamydiota bacterium]
MHTINRLKNGAQVVGVNLPFMESISVGIWIGIGGRFEVDELLGISHFLEHLLFKGTKRRSALEITQEIEGAGGSMNAFTSQEFTCYFAKVLKDNYTVAIDILSDIVLNPIYTRKEVEKERKIIQEEIHMGIDIPSQHVQDLLDTIMWPDHPLCRQLIGTEKTLAGISHEHLISFKNEHYLPSQFVIALAGNLKDIDYIPVLESYFAVNSNKKEFSTPYFTEKAHSFTVTSQYRKTEQTHVALGIRSYPRDDKKRLALKLLNVILGGNMSSRLFQVIREKEGLSYDISSQVESFFDTGALIISAGLDNKRVKKGVSCIISELKKLKRETVSSVEFENAKKYAIGQLRLMNEKTSSHMFYAGESLLCLGKIKSINEVIQTLKKLTCDDIKKVANELFINEKLSLALIGPLKNMDTIKEEMNLD